MPRKVSVVVRGEHRESGELSKEGYVLETRAMGEYYYKDGKHFIRYEEESGEGAVSNYIKIQETAMEHIKKGAMQSHMNFEKGKLHHSRYLTPVGELLVGVETKKFQCRENEEGIFVTTEYDLLVGEEKIAETMVELLIEYLQGEEEEE